MLPPTLSVVLRTSKPNAQGLCPISIVATQKGKRQYNSTGLRIKPEQWRNGKVVAHPNAALYNATIAKRIQEIEAHYLQGRPADLPEFFTYADQQLLIADVADGTKRRWKFCLDDVRSFDPNATWLTITPVWLTKLQAHLVQRMAVASARAAFVMLRWVFNKARNQGLQVPYPFAEWKLPTCKPKPRPYLTLDELNKLEALLDVALPDTLRSTLLHFLLECYSGIRYSDWSKWEVESLSGARSLKATTTKTNASVYLPLEHSPRLARVVDLIEQEGRYTHTVQEANRALKSLAVMAGLSTHLTTHVGRHTAATLLLDKGFSRETVAEVLGVSMRIVDVYAKMTRLKVRSEFERLGGL